jgi:membrane fusion protein, multidrug efflux system
LPTPGDPGKNQIEYPSQLRTNGIIFLFHVVFLAGHVPGQGPRVETVKVETVAVVARAVAQSVPLPGKLLPYQQVSPTARLDGFVSEVLVDRGSVVNKGDLLVRLIAPELQAQRAEAQAREQAAEGARSEAQARLTAEEGVLARMRKAAETPGTIAPKEIEEEEEAVNAARSYLKARTESVDAARASGMASREMEQFLSVSAPFSGVVTQRFVRPGSPVKRGVSELLEIQDLTKLRLVIAAPETNTGDIAPGTRVAFKVPEFPSETFFGIVPKAPTMARTTPVELEVVNRGGRLASGMRPEVAWPVKPILLVPPTCIMVWGDKTFVIRVKDGRAKWVIVKKGDASGDLVEVTGALAAGEMLVRQANSQIHDGAAVTVATHKAN